MSALAAKIRACLTLDPDTIGSVVAVDAEGDHFLGVRLTPADIETIAHALEWREANVETVIEERDAGPVKTTDEPSREDLETVLRAVLTATNIYLGTEQGNGLRESGGTYYVTSRGGFGPKLTFAEAVARAARIIREES